MRDKQSSYGHGQWLIAFLVACILITIYVFTYSGRIESGDTRTLFNATASLVDFGDVLLDKTAADSPPDAPPPNSTYPLATAEVEPLQLILSAPLYWIAKHIPQVGLVHAVWFFNIFVCSAICVVFYFYALTLGYSTSISVTASLLLGVGTVLWPYSKTFFREPLACLFILLTAFCIERWREQKYRSFRYLVAILIGLIGAFLSKEAVIFALPAFVVIAVPSIHIQIRWFIILIVICFLLVVGFVVVSVFAPLLPMEQIYTVMGQLLKRSPDAIRTAHLAAHTYLLSIGGSIWGSSPILLLSLGGLVIFYRQRHFRYVFAIFVLLLSFAGGYALLRGDHWFGGLSWPPRFLIPIIPFVMLGVLPLLELAFRTRKSWWLISIVAIVSVYGLWVQVCAVSYDWSVYIGLLPPEANGLVEWGGGLNVVRFLRWVLIPTVWGKIPLDFAWIRLNVILWPVVCVIAFVTCLVWLVNLVRVHGAVPARSGKESKVMAVIFAVVGCVLLVVGLQSISDDDTYSGSNAALRAVVPFLQDNSKDEDVLLLADNEYEGFFLNQGKLTHPRVVSLPDAPGEQPSREQQAVVRSTNPDELLVKTSVPLIHTLANYRSTLWLLADLGPYHPWAVRPVERFMVTHYYPIREVMPEPQDPRVRLIEYSTADAPDPFAFRGPDVMTDLRFGKDIRLVGFTLPKGQRYTAKDIVPISLYWQSDAVISQNYTVACFVADMSGNVVAQGADTQPAWGFSPTSNWKENVPYWDNRALRLPSMLPTGEYQIWVRLYQSDNSSIQLPVTGALVKDGTIGILPIIVHVDS